MPGAMFCTSRMDRQACPLCDRMFVKMHTHYLAKHAYTFVTLKRDDNNTWVPGRVTCDMEILEESDAWYDDYGNGTYAYEFAKNGRCATATGYWGLSIKMRGNTVIGVYYITPRERLITYSYEGEVREGPIVKKCVITDPAGTDTAL